MGCYWRVAIYIFLTDFKLLIICHYVGKKFAFGCKKSISEATTEFPNYKHFEESNCEEIFGLYLPTGHEFMHKDEEEITHFCNNNLKLDIWLNAIANKPLFISGYSKVINKTFDYVFNNSNKVTCHIGPLQVKCRLLFSSTFDAINL